MDFQHSPRAQEYLTRLQEFMDDAVSRPSRSTPSSAASWPPPAGPHDLPAVVEDLKAEARARGLWNLFLPDAPTPPTACPSSTTPRSPS